MAKSKEQKQQEALERQRKSYAMQLEYFLLFSPTHIHWDRDFYDFLLWVRRFNHMCNLAKEYGLHYDGREVYSSDTLMSTEAILSSMLRADYILSVTENMSDQIILTGRDPEKQCTHAQWMERKPQVIEFLNHPKTQELFQSFN